MSKVDENLIPDDYWNTMTEEEKEGIFKAMAESEEFLDEVQFEELDEGYYARLRERFGKGEDEIGPRAFKSYKSIHAPIFIMVIPAGRQHDGENMVQWYHTILEDMEHGEVNGDYELINEGQLKSKFNINYNNK